METNGRLPKKGILKQERIDYGEYGHTLELSYDPIILYSTFYANYTS
jgi:hypothetical protein